MSSDAAAAAEFRQFLASLQDSPELVSLALEIEALEAIYGEGVLRIYDASAGQPSSIQPELRADRIRFEAVLPLPDDESVSVTVLVSIPPGYPDAEHSAPQLQLLNRYIGDFGVDSGLFGRVLRTFYSLPPPDGEGVPCSPGDVVVWEGLEHIRKISQEWYTANVEAQRASDSQRMTPGGVNPSSSTALFPRMLPTPPAVFTPSVVEPLPAGIDIHVSDPIVDRKSVFIGRAVRITDPAHIPLILSHLLEDKKIAKAAHPIIHAYRVRGPGESIIQDNDDDGESAAGGRIAHLLQILDVMDVLVIVSRWFGGIHLGADRFKHIGQAARDALEIGGFLDDKTGKAAASSRGGKAGKGK